MTTETTRQALRLLLEETMRQAAQKQEAAIAGFIRAAALHLQLSTCAIADDVHVSAGTPPSAKPLADAAAGAAQIAVKLDELQRLAWDIANRLSASRPPSSLRQPSAASEAAFSNVRFSSPEKASPAWFASQDKRKKLRISSRSNGGPSK
ncbi:hypothetical protein [Cohnella hashimotonis]|uniref:Uncharacterized protein n=1 Tax=Cohnella hashimotonis TaxID=2826895 RepID=A0ABT6TNZ1_9BACL|nr:hypothetical protein [Cohnella hashimotonis]MDI4648551.1 hypothetical protein [Cohnella hashimotonis]